MAWWIIICLSKAQCLLSQRWHILSTSKSDTVTIHGRRWMSTKSMSSIWAYEALHLKRQMLLSPSCLEEPSTSDGHTRHQHAVWTSIIHVFGAGDISSTAYLSWLSALSARSRVYLRLTFWWGDRDVQWVECVRVSVCRLRPDPELFYRQNSSVHSTQYSSI